MKFVDTDIILRYLTRDDPKKAEGCYQLFQRANSGEEILLVSEAIIAEVVYVLRSWRAGYGLGREEIRARLIPILSLRGLRLPQKQLYFDALNIYASSTSFDFEDAVAVAHMQHQGINEIFSYDKDFDAYPGIDRLEPPPSNPPPPQSPAPRSDR